MRREISSSATSFYKVLFPLIYGISLPIFFLSNIRDFSMMLVIISIPVIGFAVIFILQILQLKKVEMTDSGLFISQINFGKNAEIFVLFEEIEQVKRSFWIKGNFENVIIEFKNPTKFGRKISFIAKTRIFGFFEHPIIGELNRKINASPYRANSKMRNP